MTSLAFWFVSFLASTALVQQVHSQPFHPRKKASLARASDRRGSEFVDHPFDVAATSLTRGFEGVDVKRLVNSIRNSELLAKRSEYETTSQYQSRISSFANSSLLNDITPRTTIAFVVGDKDVADTSPVDARYDADLQAFLVKLDFRESDFFLENSHPTYQVIDMQQTFDPTETYAASNAMGAKTRVESTQGQSFGIAVPKRHWIFTQTGGNESSNQPIFAVGVPVGLAPTIKAQLRVAIVGLMISPYYLQRELTKAATFSSPTSLLVEQSYVAFFPTEIIFFRRDSGNVLRRVVLPVQNSLIAESDQSDLGDIHRPGKRQEGSTPVKIASGAASEQLLRKVDAVYPRVAEAAHMTGSVVLHVFISASGSVERAVAVSGPEILRQAAIDAVMQWQYRPYLQNGAPSPVDTTIVITFKL